MDAVAQHEAELGVAAAAAINAIMGFLISASTTALTGLGMRLALLSGSLVGGACAVLQSRLHDWNSALAARGAYRLSANDVNTFWEDGDGVVHVSLHMRWRPHAEEAADPTNLDHPSGLIRFHPLASGDFDCVNDIATAFGSLSLVDAGERQAGALRRSASTSAGG